MWSIKVRHAFDVANSITNKWWCFSNTRDGNQIALVELFQWVAVLQMWLQLSHRLTPPYLNFTRIMIVNSVSDSESDTEVSSSTQKSLFHVDSPFFPLYQHATIFHERERVEHLHHTFWWYRLKTQKRQPSSVAEESWSSSCGEMRGHFVFPCGSAYFLRLPRLLSRSIYHYYPAFLCPLRIKWEFRAQLPYPDISNILWSHSEPQVGTKLLSPKPISTKISTLNGIWETLGGAGISAPVVEESTHVAEAERAIVASRSVSRAFFFFFLIVCLW